MKSQPEVKPALDIVVTIATDIEQQPLRKGGLTEYAEAASTVNAVGAVDGLPVRMKGVGHCESVGFEDPHEQITIEKRGWYLYQRTGMKKAALNMGIVAYRANQLTPRLWVSYYTLLAIPENLASGKVPTLNAAPA